MFVAFYHNKHPSLFNNSLPIRKYLLRRGRRGVTNSEGLVDNLRYRQKNIHEEARFENSQLPKPRFLKWEIQI